MTTRSAHRSRTVALLALLGIAALVITIGIVLGLTGQAEHPAPGTSPTPGAGASDGGDGSDGGGSEPPPASDPDPSPPPDEAERTAQCPEPTTTVEDTAGLHSALEQARPGDVIRLAPGTYEGEFVARAAGSAESPITLRGDADAVLDGGEPDGGYTLHLDGASHWHLLGFTVTGGQKGVMLDRTEHSVIEGLTVSRTGDEAIHLRTHSSHNTVVGNHVSGTGLRKPKFGEGIYIGSAESNWEELPDGEPDASDGNLIEGNHIEDVTAEAVDIKEGTTGGILRDNTFDGSGIVDDDTADSWVDVKGNDWLIEGNTGTASPVDGFQTHEILDGWGTGNVFRGNTADMTDGEHAFSLTPELENVVECSNEVSGTVQQVTNVSCVEDAATP